MSSGPGPFERLVIAVPILVIAFVAIYVFLGRSDDDGD